MEKKREEGNLSQFKVVDDLVNARNLYDNRLHDLFHPFVEKSTRFR